MELSNLRIKLTARGTFTHGKKRWRSHAAAYPRRSAGIAECFGAAHAD